MVEVTRVSAVRAGQGRNRDRFHGQEQVMAARLPFSAGGLDGAFTALVGTVIATERSSDSRVTGGGYTTSVNGQVFGDTKIMTDVSVTRDMWLRDADGEEHHTRLNFDLPVRVGQRFAFVYYKGAIRRSKLQVTWWIRILNLSTGRYHDVNPTKLIAGALSSTSAELFFLRLAENLGLPASLLLVMRRGMAGSAGTREAQKIQDIVDAKFRDMLALVDAEGARLAAATETPAGARAQSRTAS